MQDWDLVKCLCGQHDEIERLYKAGGIYIQLRVPVSPRYDNNAQRQQADHIQGDARGDAMIGEEKAGGRSDCRCPQNYATRLSLSPGFKEV